MKLPNASFAESDYELISDKPLYHGFFSLNQYTFKHRLHAGGWSEPVTRELFEPGPAVGGLLYDPILDQVVLIEQFRIGACHGKQSPWLLEIVAGKCDRADESLEALIIRETQEEAGLLSQQVMPIGSYWVSPGGSAEKMTLFLVIVDASNAGGVYGTKAENEDIKAVVFDSADAFALVAAGRINNASAIIALQWLQINYHNIGQMFILKDK